LLDKRRPINVRNNFYFLRLTCNNLLTFDPQAAKCLETFLQNVPDVATSKNQLLFKYAKYLRFEPLTKCSQRLLSGRRMLRQVVPDHSVD